jgi:hypothetical protein
MSDDRKVDYKLPQHRVSGVPYAVQLAEAIFMGKCEPLGQDDMIATLEHENRLMRARMDRLEDELRVANELVNRLNIQIINMSNDGK